jgi:hypothetical protein
MNHEAIEKNIWLMVPLIILAISFGSLVELVVLRPIGILLMEKSRLPASTFPVKYLVWMALPKISIQIPR